MTMVTLPWSFILQTPLGASSRPASPMVPSQAEYWDAKATATYLGMSQKWLIQSGRGLMPIYKFGKANRWRRAEVEAFALSQRVA